MSISINTIEGRRGSACLHNAFAIVANQTELVDIIPAADLADKDIGCAEIKAAYSDALKQNVHLRVSSHALRSVEARGGLDAYLLKARDSELSDKALRLKRKITKVAEATAS